MKAPAEEKRFCCRGEVTTKVESSIYDVDCPQEAFVKAYAQGN